MVFRGFQVLALSMVQDLFFLKSSGLGMRSELLASKLTYLEVQWVITVQNT